MLSTIVTSVAWAVVLSLVSYSSEWLGPDRESFKPRKLLRTVIIGLVVGVAAVQMGVQLSLTNFGDIVAAVGATGLADQITKAVWRGLRRLREGMRTAQ